jgi:hypothetical protein
MLQPVNYQYNNSIKKNVIHFHNLILKPSLVVVIIIISSVSFGMNVSISGYNVRKYKEIRSSTN